MGKYDDIINLPHHESKNHSRMSRTNRAAQFAPFAALVGFSESIKNSEEILDNYVELSEDRIKEIEQSLENIMAKIKSNPQVEVTYFEKTKDNNQGKYLKFTGKIKKYDEFDKKIIFTNKKTILIKNIYNIREIYE